MKFNAGASYLKESEWGSISVYLDPFISELINISKGVPLDVKCSQRWPSIELSRKKNGTIDSFKFLLNSSYLDDNKIFFELIYTQFQEKFFGGGVVNKTETLGRYSLQDMNDVEVVLEDITVKLTDKM